MLHSSECRGGLEDLALMSQKLTDCPETLEEKLRCPQLGCPCPPLLAAVRAGHRDCVAFLLDAGASPNSFTRGNETALQVAIVNRQVDLVELLLERGASCSSIYSNYLNLATMVGHLHILKLLLEHGADPNHADSSSLTPSQIAIRHNQDESLKLLLLYGASVDKPDLVHYLIQNSRFQTKRWEKKIRMIALLWSFGANFRRKNEAGLNVFDVINDSHYPSVASKALFPILHEICTTPRSLQDSARLVIRKTIGNNSYLSGI